MSLLNAQGIDGFHKSLNKTRLFDSNPERWHRIAMKMSDIAERSTSILDSISSEFYMEDLSLEVQVGDMTFKNPVGLSA